MSEVLYILTGPTAVGKTELSLSWAEKNDAEIVSCDASLVYQGMNIGTAKPTAEELSRVPHHCLNLVSVGQAFNVFEYVRAAKVAVEDILNRGKKVLVTGGTGFYLKAFFQGIVDTIEVPLAVKEQVQNLEKVEGIQGLADLLLKLNPQGIGTLDIHNPRRVVKALERCLASGKTVSELKSEFEAQEGIFDAYKKSVTLLNRSKESLAVRIVQRVDQMLESGLIEEVQHLIEQGIQANPTASIAIGYRETIAWLKEGRGNIEELRAEIVQNTVKLVAKQRKWFRNQIVVDQVLDLDEQPPQLPQLFR